MAGASIELDTAEVRTAIAAALGVLDNPAPLLQSISEHLQRAHRKRFAAQVSPDGQPWAPLSPRYLRRKHRNRDKVLTLRGHLRNTLRGQIEGRELAFGTDRKYGAIHHFGGGQTGAGGIPARPWLGTSRTDNDKIIELTKRHLLRALNKRR